MLILVECAYELLLLGVPTMSWILTGDPCLPLQKYPPGFLDQTNPLDPQALPSQPVEQNRAGKPGRAFALRCMVLP